MTKYTRGITMQRKTDRWPDDYREAVTQLAAEETLKIRQIPGYEKATIGFATFHQTIATQRGRQITELKERLNERINHIQEEKKNHALNTSKPTRRDLDI